MSATLPHIVAEGVSVRFWGVRGSIPSPGPETARYGGNTSCVEVRAGRQIIILDAGSGIRRLGVQLAHEFGAAPVNATILMSHTHWDHIQGLPFFSPAYSAENRIRILGAPGTRARLKEAFELQMRVAVFPVALERLAGITAIDEFESGETLLDDISVRTFALNHPGGCTGFRFDTRGASIAYLPDHEPYGSGAEQCDRELVEFLAGTDLLVLDSQYDRAEYPTRVGWGHGCLDESVALALRAGARTLMLFHHDPDHNDNKIDAMLGAARQQVAQAGANLQVRAARERERLVVNARQQLAA